jgi:hypothetical protein
MFDSPLTQMLRDAFLVSGNGVDRKPLPRTLRSGCETLGRLREFHASGSGCFGQSFAILTWVGFSTEPPTSNPDAPPPLETLNESTCFHCAVTAIVLLLNQIYQEYSKQSFKTLQTKVNLAIT